MRILLINQYAGAPSLGMEYRPHWMALEWQKLGHEVLIVAGDRSHLRRVQPAVGRSPIGGVDFLTLRTPPYGENGPRRFANILAFRSQLYRKAGALAKWRPDVVIASSTHPMDIRPALRIARKADALFVHEVHDLWPLTPKLLGGMSDWHPMIMWMQREEDLACLEADLVVSILPATLPYLQARGLDANRWVQVSNGVPDESVRRKVTPPSSGHEKFRVGYFGAHGAANDLETLIEAARRLQNDALEVHLWGAGPAKSAVQQRASDLRNVLFHDPVSPTAARREMEGMDALYIGLADSPLFEHGISPNKMFEYMAVGRPLIQAINAPASPAEEAGCATICTPGDPDSVVRAITRVRDLSQDEREVMGAAGLEYVRGRATYASLAKSFIAAVESAVANRQGPGIHSP